MTSEQLEKITKHFIALLRAHFQLQADTMGLELIIKASITTNNPVPTFWLESLNQILSCLS